MRTDWKCLVLIRCGCLLVLLCLLGFPDSGSTNTIIDDVLDPIDDPDVSSVASANTRFGFKLLQDLRERDSRRKYLHLSVKYFYRADHDL